MAANLNKDQINAIIEDGVLLPYQKAWVADTATVKIADKSRRTGLTWAEAADAVLTAAAARSAGGCNHFYIGTTKEMAREFIDACGMWTRAFNKAAGEVQEEILLDENGDKEILTFVIHFPNSNFKIQALSSRPSSLRGMQGNVTIDEAAFHESLAEVLKAALALTMWGSKVRIISTHNGVDNPFNELLLECKSGKRKYSVHSIPLDVACQQGLYKRICQVTGKTWTKEAEDAWIQGLINDAPTVEDAQEEYFCIPKQGGGVYLSRTLLESRADPVPVVRFVGDEAFNNAPLIERQQQINDWLNANIKPLLTTLDEMQDHALGQDFARSGDLTVMNPLAISQTLMRRTPFLVELKNVPFAQQQQILFFILHGLPRLCGVQLDARGNGQQIAEATRDEFGSHLVECVMLTQSWYAEHMPRMKKAFEDDELRTVKDKDVIDDLRAVQVIKGIPKIPEGNTSGNAAQRRHGDAAVALCLAYAATFMDGSAFGYESARITSDKQDEYRDIKTGFGITGRSGSIL